MRSISRIIASLVLLGASGLSLASTAPDRESEQSSPVESRMKLSLRQAGYTIKLFRETGVCYEVCARDRRGREAELYFNPVDGSIAKKG
ncbi:PepSY domain-containing protein [Paludibacterium yongneupense]|uniref:PepSY domain-containing protein n=1 Tax=Paludibacterium yongneupense TaxID=400061 RepID=UPI0003FF8478|nr:PepSY domain-containing protein [Paludibacterium yongneupense]